MRKRMLSLALALIMVLGLAVPSLAAGPTFTDVPEGHWAYADVETAAAEGLMKGTGGGLFSPDMKVSVAQFLTLVGRVVFPDVKAEGDNWYGPYITAAQEGGLLTGTQVNVNTPEAEISRYDMAVILRGAAKKLGAKETLAQSSQVTDYGLIPNMYTEAVLAVYGMGLIQGDQNGNFNGANTMMRSEVVTVVVRLFKLKPSSGSTPGGTTTKPEQPRKPQGPLEPEIIEMPKDEEMATYKVFVTLQKIEHELGAPAYDTKHRLSDVPVKLYYTYDGGKTAILVADGKTSQPNQRGLVQAAEFDFVAPKSWGNYAENHGFFVSAETVYEGERLVTSDLRTDGRAYVEYQRCAADGRTGWDIELTPPEGLKIHFTFAGRAETLLGKRAVPGATVQLYHKNGALIGEAIAGADGQFEMDCAVDILDGVLNTREKMYQVAAQGELDGKPVIQSTNDIVGAPLFYSLDWLGCDPNSLTYSQGSYRTQLK